MMASLHMAESSLPMPQFPHMARVVPDLLGSFPLILAHRQPLLSRASSSEFWSPLGRSAPFQLGRSSQQVHAGKDYDGSVAFVVPSWLGEEPLFWMALETRRWDLRVQDLQPDHVLIFQVTLMLRLELFPPQNPPWPEMSQRV